MLRDSIGLLLIPVLIVSLAASAGMAQTLVINEFMASNSNGETDPQGQNDDWIEIYNYGTDAINMAGMYLTDDLSIPNKWQFPAGTSIQADGYLIIWADEDTTDAGLHANFKLDADGEEIGLFDSDGTTLIDGTTFSRQTADISFGRYPDASNDWCFFTLPSPGQQNGDGYLGIVADTKFSMDRGFYDSPFYVTITTDTEGATIYYSLDGSDPLLPNLRGDPQGTIYTGPILISGTTSLRAGAVKTGWKQTDVDTQTYLFTSDIIQQTRESALAAGLPSSWGSRSADYGLDPDVIGPGDQFGGVYVAIIEDCLKSIPTISLTLDNDDFFGPTGIYTNVEGRDEFWERPASAELIFPDGREGFQINAGLRIHGSASRHLSRKNGLRLLFKSQYGPTKLEYPLFGEEGVTEFDTIVLRPHFNDGWGWDGALDDPLYIRDQWFRNSQIAMGHVSPRGNVVHLYVNGLYWGLYNPSERPDDSFAAEHFGGEKQEYDVVYHDGLHSGSITAYNTMISIAQQVSSASTAVGKNAAYQLLQGNFPDGTNDPASEDYLDVTNYIDYMILNHYGGNDDWPGRNWFSSRRRGIESEGFRFFAWDSEISLCLSSRTSIDESYVGLTSGAARAFGYLRNYDEFRMQFADRVHHYLFNDGVLYVNPDNPQYDPDNPQDNVPAARFDALARTVYDAIVAESARWGDQHVSTPRTRDIDWQNELDYMLETYFTFRHDIVLAQWRSAGLYPSIDAPVFYIDGSYQHGGWAAKNSLFSMTNTTGTIYYSLDGTDPRLPGTTEPSNQAMLVPENAPKRLLVPAGPISDNWTGGRIFNDNAWVSGSGGVGYEISSGYEQYIGLDVRNRMYGINSSCYIRIPFTFDMSEDDILSLTLGIRYDDGFVVYLNGEEVARRNFTGTPAWNSSADTNHSDSEAVNFEEIDISSRLSSLNSGDNILAIHGLNQSITSSDFLISVKLVAVTDNSSSDSGAEIPTGIMQYSAPITLTESAHIKARVLSGSTWSALNEATYAVGPVAENLRITEIMYHPQNQADPNEEFIELTNIGAETINLNLVKFTNGIDFIFPSVELGPGEYIVVVQDIDAFETRYGTQVNIAGQYSASLANDGERIRLEDAVGQTILDFSYKDGWYDGTDGQGYSLVIINPLNPADSWDDKDSWRAGTIIGGSPGWAE